MNQAQTVSGPRLIVALDFSDPKPVNDLIRRLDPAQCRMKVGKELFTSAGPAIVEQIQQRGFEVFLDLKFHDIPNTVASACRAAANLGVWMLNVHTLGGAAMMQAAREAIDQSRAQTLLIGVTILTSHDGASLQQIGLTDNVAYHVQQLAHLAQQSGLDGIVCSALEVAELKRQLGEPFLFVTPGVRLAGGSADDQKRIVTPVQAMQNGSSYIVVGRPVTQAQDPLAVVAQITQELG